MMKAYSKDLREKIVDAIAQRGMPKTEAACAFGVGISTLKRYMSKAQRGESLEPGKAPGRAPKIGERERKLLEEDLIKSVPLPGSRRGATICKRSPELG